VVLKRLDDALADGDHVHAVVKAAACNNDGAVKVSFMAPSVDGQVDVYERAYAEAGISPATVGYVECHGTGTALGDPIEFTALNQVFSAAGAERNGTAIGSLKTNIGHLDTAAGACALIKATLTVEHGMIPPSLHFERPNPQIDFASSPFFVNTELRPWGGDGTPRRAGVTSLGMGGTNAHVVLEEAPPVPAPEPSRAWQLLLLSAKTESALDTATSRLGEALGESTDALSDIAFTLQMGRKPFAHRRMLLCQDGPEAMDDAARALTGRDPQRLLSGYYAGGDRPVAFLFPGQGAQYPGMGRGLYETEQSFREDVDRCAELLVPHLELDLRDLLFPAEGADGANAAEQAAARALQQTAITQPALFTICWASARLWMRWGVKPAAMLGHSIGEYAAACLAGVFTLEDALAVVAARGALMQQMPPGAMLAVPLPEDEVLPLLSAEGAGPGGGKLSLAAVNRPRVSVVSGPAEAIDELAARLADVPCRRLHTSHAFHSRMMDPVLPAFIETVKGVRLEPPKIPYLSNVTGTWIRPEEATDPTYYARQLRGTVLFAKGVAELLVEPQRLLLEVGPGNTLSTLARQHPDRRPAQAVVSSIRHPKEERDDQACLVEAVGRLWLAGATVDWSGFWAGERRRRVPLPTYPFERARYWVDPPTADDRAAAGAAPRRTGRLPMEEWAYAPAWHRQPLLAAAAMALGPARPSAGADAPADWLLFADRTGVAEALAARLAAAGQRVALVTEPAAPPAMELPVPPGVPGNGKGNGSGALAGSGSPAAGAVRGAIVRHRLASNAPEAYEEVLRAVRHLDADGGVDSRLPERIVHLANVTGAAPASDLADDVDREVDHALERSYFSLVHLARALQRVVPDLSDGPGDGSGGSGGSGESGESGEAAGPAIRLAIVSDGLQEVTGLEALDPLKAALLGPCGVIPRELPAVACRSIDLDAGAPPERSAARLLAELRREPKGGEGRLDDRPVALRGRHRWVRSFEPVPLAAPGAGRSPLRDRGVYLVTGGLGGLGLEVAGWLAREVRARLVLVGRSPFPARESWDTWCAGHPADDPVSERIGRLRAMEATGAEVLVVSADVSRPEEVRAVRAAAVEQFGAVHGVIHAAGVPGGGLIATRERAAAERVLAPKVRGALALDAVFGDAPLDCFVLFSSVTAVLPQAGQADYVAANAFLDAFAAGRSARRSDSTGCTVAIGWDAWRETGMAVTTEVPEELRAWREETLRQGLASAEGVEVLERVLAAVGSSDGWGGDLSQVVVSTLDLAARAAALAEPEALALGGGSAGSEASAPTSMAGSSVHPRPALANPFVAPTNASEEAVAAIWKEMLGIEPVGIHDNFFDLGGNSLTGLRITRALKDRLSVGISDVSLYEAPTVAALAQMVDGGNGDGRGSGGASGGDEGAAGEQPVATVTASVSALESRGRGERRKARLMARRGLLHEEPAEGRPEDE